MGDTVDVMDLRLFFQNNTVNSHCWCDTDTPHSAENTLVCSWTAPLSSLLLISFRSYLFCSFTCPYSFLLIIICSSSLSTIYVLFIQLLLVCHLLHPSAYSRTSHPNHNQLVWSLFNSDDPGSHKNGFQLAPKRNELWKVAYCFQTYSHSLGWFQ